MTDAKKNPDAATSGLKDRTPSKENNLMAKNTRIDEATRTHYAQLLADFLELDNETRAAHPLTSDWIGTVPGWADESTVDIDTASATVGVQHIARNTDTEAQIARFFVFSLLTADVEEDNAWVHFPRTDDGGDVLLSEALAAARWVIAMAAQIEED